jgi:dihydroorotate dehydrogenase (NAD+) catalytic subunit
MIEITRPSKQSLSIRNHVMIASGMMGFDPSAYRNLIKLEKLGAMVTSPITWKSRAPAHGTRVVPYHGGFLLHTGLPNAGVGQVVQKYKTSWKKSDLPIIAHVIATTPHEMYQCCQVLDGVEGITGIELGLQDSAELDEVATMIQAVREGSELPLLVKLPLYTAPLLAKVAEDEGADALVVASPPRGTERDPISGQLVGGRVYGPWLKSLALRAVGQVVHNTEIPVIACGGIHTSQDARDFIEAGACAIQVDTLLWIEPSMVEIIARHLGGLEYTRAIGAMADEWEPGLGATQAMKRRPVHDIPERPNDLPELPNDPDTETRPSGSTDEIY